MQQVNQKNEGTSYVPVNFYKSNGQPGGKLTPSDSKSTPLQELSLMNNTYFGNLHYDIHLDMKLDYTISRIFKKCHFLNKKHFINYTN